MKYLGYADETIEQPEAELLIEAGHFGVFPPEKWHLIELMTEDTVFQIDFFVEADVLRSL